MLKDTSKIAADSISGDAPQMRSKIYKLICERGFFGMTCDEIEVALYMRHQTASARIRELAQQNQIRDSGQRRLTRSDRPAIVWVKRGSK